MTTLIATIDADELQEDSNTHVRGVGYDGDLTARIANDAAENGYEQDPGPLTWLNSARVHTDPSDDAVHCVVSVGDPRGGFCFTVRRTPDGRIVLHLPHPGEGMPHMETREIHPGTLQVAGNFADPEPETDDDGDE